VVESSDWKTVVQHTLEGYLKGEFKTFNSSQTISCISTNKTQQRFYKLSCLNKYDYVKQLEILFQAWMIQFT